MRSVQPTSSFSNIIIIIIIIIIVISRYCCCCRRRILGHLDTGFSWFPCVYKRMLRWFPSFQVATTCFLCSPSDLNFLVTFFFRICVHVK